jgi:hypothetical protein
VNRQTVLESNLKIRNEKAHLPGIACEIRGQGPTGYALIGCSPHGPCSNKTVQERWVWQSTRFIDYSFIIQ